jgi:hypothetical protein
MRDGRRVGAHILESPDLYRYAGPWTVKIVLDGSFGLDGRLFGTLQVRMIFQVAANLSLVRGPSSMVWLSAKKATVSSESWEAQ